MDFSASSPALQLVQLITHSAQQGRWILLRVKVTN